MSRDVGNEMMRCDSKMRDAKSRDTQVILLCFAHHGKVSSSSISKAFRY